MKGTISGDDKHNLEDCKNCTAKVKSKPVKSEDRVSIYAMGRALSDWSSANIKARKCLAIVGCVSRHATLRNKGPQLISPKLFQTIRCIDCLSNGGCCHCATCPSLRTPFKLMLEREKSGDMVT